MTLYFNNAVNTSLNTLGNYWLNEGCTTPAAALPTASDDIILPASNLNGAGGSATCNSITLSGGSQILNGATITGDVILNGSSWWSWSTVTGDLTLNGTSRAIGGSLTGNASIHDSAWFVIAISGTAVFSDAIEGVHTVPSAGQWGGSASGFLDSLGDPLTKVIFSSGSHNHGSVPCDAQFLAGNGGILELQAGQMWGVVLGDVFGADGAPLTSLVFRDGSFMGGSFSGEAYFEGGSYNNFNDIGGNAEFSGTSRQNGGTIWGDALFRDAAGNYGTVRGNALFYDTAENHGNILGDVTFSGSSQNLSFVGGYITTPWIRDGADLISDKAAGMKLKFSNVPEGAVSEILGTGLL